MSYYRSALAAACTGDLTNAARLIRCSIALDEGAPSAARLFNLLERQFQIDAEALEHLRTLTGARMYKKALKVKLAQTSRAHTIRGLLYAQIGRRRKAREEFIQALSLDKGNDLAMQALLQCGGEMRL